MNPNNNQQQPGFNVYPPQGVGMPMPMQPQVQHSAGFAYPPQQVPYQGAPPVGYMQQPQQPYPQNVYPTQNAYPPVMPQNQFGMGMQPPVYGQAAPTQSYPAGQPPIYGQAAPTQPCPVSQQHVVGQAAPTQSSPVAQPAQPAVGQAVPTQSISVTQLIQSNDVHHQPSQSQPAKHGRPTLRPATNFDASSDAAELRRAMKGLGTDEAALINVICRRTNEQRMAINKAFKTAYGKVLNEELHSETSGNFRKVLLALMTPTIDFYCEELFRAVNGLGTDDIALIEIMCSLPTAEIPLVSARYKDKFGRTLESDLRGDTSGDFKRVLVSLLNDGRDQSTTTNMKQANEDAQLLKKAGVDNVGTNESEFNRILCSRNYAQLRLICEEYAAITDSSLEADVKKEFSGNVKKAHLAILNVAQNRPEYFARCLHRSMHGLGTDDKALIRLVVTRAEIDMEDVKEEFLKLFKKTLKSYIEGDTSGYYKKALLTLCGEI